MIKQVLKEEGRMEGLQEGLQEGHFNMLSLALMEKYQRPLEDMKMLKGMGPEEQLELMKLILDCDSFSDIEKWIQQRKSRNRS